MTVGEVLSGFYAKKAFQLKNNPLCYHFGDLKTIFLLETFPFIHIAYHVIFILCILVYCSLIVYTCSEIGRNGRRS